MNDMSIQFIEDPKIAASIDALKQRWPRIARAADHPLTEHFIRRGTPGRIVLRFAMAKARFLNSILVILISILWFGAARNFIAGILWTFIIGMIGIHVLVVVVRTIHGYYERKSPITNMREPLDVLRENDPGRLDQLYLANVQFKDLLGATAALYYHHWVGCAAVRALLLAITWCVLAFFIGLTGHQDVNMVIDMCMAVFFAGIGWVVCRPSAIVEAGMQDLFSHLRNRKTRLHTKAGGVLPGFLWFILACTPIITGVVYPVLGFPGWIAVTILAWIAEFARLARVLDDELQMYFDHCVEDGGRMLQSMLNEESSDPLKDLELYGRMMQLEHRRNAEMKIQSHRDG